LYKRDCKLSLISIYSRTHRVLIVIHKIMKVFHWLSDCSGQDQYLEWIVICNQHKEHHMWGSWISISLPCDVLYAIFICNFLLITGLFLILWKWSSFFRKFRLSGLSAFRVTEGDLQLQLDLDRWWSSACGISSSIHDDEKLCFLIEHLLIFSSFWYQWFRL